MLTLRTRIRFVVSVCALALVAGVSLWFSPAWSAGQAAALAQTQSNYPSCPVNPTPLGVFTAPAGTTTFDTTNLTSSAGNGQDINGLAVWTFDSVSVPSGATLVGVGSRPLVIISRSNMNISGAVSVAGGNSTSVVGEGGAGGGAGGPGGGSAPAAGSGPGGGQPGIGSTGTGSMSFSGGGGGGFGGAGGAGGQSNVGSPGVGGATYGILATTLQGGSGGGSGGDQSGGGGCTPAGGGGGGGVLLSAAGTLTIAGQVNANGGRGIGGAPCGGSSASGGGSGGAIVLAAQSVTNSGSVTAQGGAADSPTVDGRGGGGGGGGGRIYVSAHAITGGGSYSAAGGAGGTSIGALSQPGAAGAVGEVTQDTTGALVLSCCVSNPVVSITGPPSGSIYAVGTPVNFSGTFTDASGGATHTATWTFDSLTQPGTVNETAGTVNTTRSFTQAGVYQVSLTVANNCGLSGTANTVGADQFTALVVIYDPSAGWVTGGGWINSPAGALVGSTLTGKANFGFVSKYQRGNSVPTGNTEFQFKAGNLNFKSTVYEWMVIAGARAQYRGAGKNNNAGDYRFMLTAIDGQVNGGGGQDKFRIRIWNSAGGGLVYDNQLNAPDSADPTTVLGGGQIVIHSGNGNGNGNALLVLNGGTQAKTALAQSSDYDGDGKSDLWGYQATDGRWAIQASSDGVLRYAQLGSLNEVAVPADYDGDGKTDVAVFNATTQRWLIWQSSAGTIRKERFGMTDSQAYPADYDGDGKADLAVRNAQGEWQILRSSDGEVLSFALGAAEDTAVIGDFDGDGLTDAAVYRVAEQAALIRRSSNGETQAVHLPYAAGLPLAGDFDGDGQAELAFWSAEKATLRFTRSSAQQEQELTINGSALLLGDFDGDGRSDCLSWQAGRWQVHLSSRDWLKQ